MISDQLRGALNDPAALEKMFRENPVVFEQSFRSLWPEISSQPIAQVWFERLKKDELAPDEQIQWGKRSDILVAVGLGLLSGFLILFNEYFPGFLGIETDQYLTRNFILFIFPLLAVWFWRKNRLAAIQTWLAGGVVVLLAVFLNVFPWESPDPDVMPDTFFLSVVHGALLLWSLVGYVFSKGQLSSNPLRVQFLRFNGELLILLAVLSSAWGVTAGLTIGLFNLIGINLNQYHFERVLIQGMALLPFLGAFVLSVNPQLVNRVSPLVARIFSPIVLVILSIYLIAMVGKGKDPYSDREFLLNFNLLLIGVMALILFAVSGLAGFQQSKFNRIVLLALSAVTVIVNLVALSAILYRIGTWGITPNRLAVLGGNGLILVNLIWITYRLYRSHVEGTDGRSVEETISRYLPVYTLWTVVVVFIFPLLFNFK